MKTNTLIKLAAAMLLGSQTSTVLAQGSLTPPGAPAPTMKTLAQIEPRTPISSALFTINVPGSYYLTTNLVVSSGNVININTNGVTLDLNGFTIQSTVAYAAGNGIQIASGLRNITILNGFIQGGVTNNGNNVYSGSGFQNGITFSGATAPSNVRISGVTVTGCLSYGIYLGFGDSGLVECCLVRTTGDVGIMASVVKSSSATDCATSGIYGMTVSDSRGQGRQTSTEGIYAKTVQNSYGDNIAGRGISCETALNCYGTSSSSMGINCTVAENCVGMSTSSNGIRAMSTQNCFGYSDSATGLYSEIAFNCYGQSNSGYGLAYNRMAAMCFGYRSSPAGTATVLGAGSAVAAHLP
jgi:hypothetical protein